MIPTLLLVGIVFGLATGVTGRVSIAVVGAVAAVIGWWILLFAFGEIDFTIAVLIGSGLLAGINYLVGGLVGWGLGWLVRGLFKAVSTWGVEAPGSIGIKRWPEVQIRGRTT